MVEGIIGTRGGPQKYHGVSLIKRVGKKEADKLVAMKRRRERTATIRAFGTKSGLVEDRRLFKVTGKGKLTSQ